MAPATPSTSASSAKTPIHDPLADNDGDLNLISEDEDDDEDEQVTTKDLEKLKRANRKLNERLNEILDGAKESAANKQQQIDLLNAQQRDLLERNDKLAQELIGQKSMYKDFIEHTASNAAKGKDAGEILRPRQPDPYDGSATELQGFLTQLRAYQMYYPTQFITDEAKVRHGMGFLKDKALRWFEPIMRDYVNHPYDQRKNETRTIYGSYETFEHELKSFCGFQDEKRAAEIQIRKLTQKGAASTYAAEHRNAASRLNWGEEALMSDFYRGLKSDVKDAMIGKDKPTTYNGLVTLAVEIDDQQFERRQEKKAEKTGGTYTHTWKNKKNHSNHGKKRQGNTSYGTAPGPMELGAAQKDHSKVKCWNCGKMGHFESKCRAPKSNQKHKPVPEGKHVRFTNHQHPDHDEPQTAIRSKTLAMARAGYDNTGLVPDTYQLPTVGLYKSEETLKEEGYTDKPLRGKRHFITKPTKPDLEGTWKGVTNNITDDCIAFRQAHNMKTTWTPVPEPTRNNKEKPNNKTSRTIAMVRRGDTIPDRQPRPVTPPPTNRERGAKTSKKQEEKDELRRRFYTREEGTPWIHAGQETRLARKLGLTVADQDIIAPADEYSETEDEQDSGPSHGRHWKHDNLGNRMWKNPTEMYDDLANERQIPTATNPVYIRAYDMPLGRNPHHITPKEREDDDPRMAVAHPNHEEISWASCVVHKCPTHEEEKIYHNCFPVRTNNTPIQNPYLQNELKYFRVTKWYAGIGVAQLEDKGDLFPPECTNPNSTIDDCETEECRAHEQQKIREWHERKEEDILKCVATRALRCNEPDCTEHSWENRDEFQRIKFLIHRNYDFSNHRGTSSLDRAWKSKMEDWERRGMTPKCNDEEPVWNTQPCSARNAMTCDKPGCPKHGIKAQEINARIRRMHDEGFDFPTRTGTNQADQAWYRQIRNGCNECSEIGHSADSCPTKNDERHL